MQWGSRGPWWKYRYDRLLNVTHFYHLLIIWMRRTSYINGVSYHMILLKLRCRRAIWECFQEKSITFRKTSLRNCYGNVSGSDYRTCYYSQGSGATDPNTKRESIACETGFCYVSVLLCGALYIGAYHKKNMYYLENPIPYSCMTQVVYNHLGHRNWGLVQKVLIVHNVSPWDLFSNCRLTNTEME